MKTKKKKAIKSRTSAVAAFKLIKIPETNGDFFKLSRLSLSQDPNLSPCYYAYRMTKAEVRKALKARESNYENNVTAHYFFHGKNCSTTLSGYVDNQKQLNIGCKLFDEATTRTIKRWARN